MRIRVLSVFFDRFLFMKSVNVSMVNIYFYTVMILKLNICHEIYSTHQDILLMPSYSKSGVFVPANFLKFYSPM